MNRALPEDHAPVYERARQEAPQSWLGHARQWTHVVHLNPDSPHIKEPQLTLKAA
jgi:hypothetical protein